MNDAIRAIMKRRSCRKFGDDEIEAQILGQIINAGRIAPTGSNTQKICFYVISGQSLINIMEAANTSFAQMEIPETDPYSGGVTNAITKCRKGFYDFLYGAKQLVILAIDENYGNAMADCVCAQMSMMIAASALNVDSCYINQFHWLNEAAVFRKALGLEANKTICCALALGYGIPSPNGKEKRITGNPVIEMR